MGATSVYYYDDALFDSDTGRVVSDFTSPGANHSRTALHPLFVLLLNPAGSKIAKIAGSSVVAAVALNSFFGGVAAALAFLFLRRAGVGGPFAALYGGLTGFSAAHLVFGAVPETWIFAACGIIVLYFLAAEPHSGLKVFIPAGVFALAFQTPNFFQGAIVYGAKVVRESGRRAGIMKLAVFAAGVLGAGTILSLVQKRLYPTSELFFLPSVWGGEASCYFWRLGRPLEFGARLWRIIGYFFIYNIILPGFFSLPGKSYWACIPDVPRVYLKLNEMHPPGIAGAAIWLALVAAALYGAVRYRRAAGALAVAVVLSLTFNFALFALYGTRELFLYAGDSAFLVIAGVALALKRWEGGRMRYLYLGALGAALVAIALNNASAFFRIISFYGKNLLPVSWS